MMNDLIFGESDCLQWENASRKFINAPYFSDSGSIPIINWLNLSRDELHFHQN